MKKNYNSPEVEIIELEIEDAVLNTSVTGQSHSTPTINSFGDDSAW